MAVARAKALRAGDTIGLIAPASAVVPEEKISRSVEYFERHGYRVEVGKNVGRTRGFLSAPDAGRVADLHAMYRNKRVRAIFFLRGGYGTIRMLDQVDYDLIASNPKILVGYSDATALFNAIHKRTRASALFYGPMPGVDIWNGFDPFAEEQFWKVLQSSSKIGALPMSDSEGTILRKGTATGRLVGGNATVFSSIIGTPYAPGFRGKSLFFEDIDEKPYRIDRYLAQLRLAGALDGCASILLGQFKGCVADEGALTLTLEEIFRDYFGKLTIPVVSNLPSGHVARQWTIPFGARYMVDARGRQAKISIEEQVLD